MSSRFDALVPDLAKGARAAVATVVPFYLARVYDQPELMWAALGGWLGSLADPGGARPSRAAGIALFALLGGLAVGLMGSVSGSPVLAALVLGGIAWIASIARVAGSASQTVGTMVVVAAAIALSMTAPSATAGLLFAAGAIVAAFLSSIVWPVWPHRSVRRTTAAVFIALADYAAETAALARTARYGDPRWGALARVHHRAVRAALEASAVAVIEVRSRHFGETPVGANLRVLLGSAESEFFLAIALAERLEASASIDKQAVARALDELARRYRMVARALAPQPVAAPDTAPDPSSSILTRRLLEASAADLAIARDLTHESDALPTHTPAERMRSRLAHLALELRDAMCVRSPYFRHAVRVTGATIVAIVVGRLLAPHHFTWVAVTTVVVLQPYPGATFDRALQRFVGTVLGAALALAVMATVHDPLALAFVMFPLSVAAVVTRPRSYRLFVVFLTPVFLQFADNWHASPATAFARIADVALGAAIALLAVGVLPAWERTRLGTALGAATRAVEHYAMLSFDVLARGRDPAARARVVAARREVGITLGETETSLERMLAEPRRVQRGVTDAVFFVTYLRRFMSTVTALDELLLLKGDNLGDHPEVVRDMRAFVTAVFAGIAIPVPPVIPDTLPATMCSLLARVIHHGQLVAGVIARARSAVQADPEATRALPDHGVAGTTGRESTPMIRT